MRKHVIFVPEGGKTCLSAHNVILVPRSDNTIVTITEYIRPAIKVAEYDVSVDKPVEPKVQSFTDYYCVHVKSGNIIIILEG